VIRTALRLSTYAAMVAGGAGPTFPTLAGENWFDSRRDDISDIAADTRFPVGVIRTDEDRMSWMGRNASAPSGRMISRSIDMRIEFSILSALEDPETKKLKLQWPETDPAMEAFLDLFELQIIGVLEGWLGAKWSEFWRGLWTVEAITSNPLWQEVEGGRVKLAMRELLIRIAPVGADCLPKPMRAIDLPKDSSGNPIMPVGKIPPQLLATFEKIAADGGGEVQGAAAELRAIIENQALPKSPVYEALESVRVSIPESGAPPTGEEPHINIEAELLDAGD